MEERNQRIIDNISKEIERIDKKENKVFFFVIDTKGVPSGSLAYIYALAKFAEEGGYDVTMLHMEDEFVGVGSWLGEDYARLRHENVNSGEINTSASDILFIPDIFAQVMNQTKHLPCKKVAILQNYNYVVEQMPFAAQWGDFGVIDAVVNTEYQASLIKSVFPYVRTKIVTPFIDEVFGTTSDPKKMIVNVIARDQSDIKKIVKPFYWKYPQFKWVSFRDIRGESRERFASLLREAAITICVDDDTSFGYSALEAMKSGSIVMVKVPNTEASWMKDGDEYRNCCVWFDNFEDVHKQIASVVRSWITDKVPSILAEEVEKTVKPYTRENTKKEFMEYLSNLLSLRVSEMERLIEQVKNGEV